MKPKIGIRLLAVMLTLLFCATGFPLFVLAEDPLTIESTQVRYTGVMLRDMSVQIGRAHV